MGRALAPVVSVASFAFLALSEPLEVGRLLLLLGWEGEGTAGVAMGECEWAAELGEERWRLGLENSGLEVGSEEEVGRGRFDMLVACVVVVLGMRRCAGFVKLTLERRHRSEDGAGVAHSRMP